MASVLWAIGATAILILFITFLPLGFTIKGKLILPFVSFVLSLGGLATLSIFTLWQTALMLFALVFFASYFMNNRIGTLIFHNGSVFEDVYDEELKTPDTMYEIESLRDVNLIDNNEDLALPVSSDINLEKVAETELSPAPIMNSIEETINDITEINDEDISFLQERNTEVVVYDQSEVTNGENGYLSDIESLIELESKQEDLLELSPIIVEVKKPAQLDVEEDEPLDDSLFDFLLAQKEVAADRDILNEIEPKNKVNLKK